MYSVILFSTSEINRIGLYQYSNKMSHNNGKGLYSIVFVYIEGQAGTYNVSHFLWPEGNGSVLTDYFHCQK